MTMKLFQIMRNRRGVGAVEFALIFPIFLLLLIGVLELGTLFLSSAGLSHAVNEAGRLATLHPTPTQAQLTAHLRDRGFGLQAQHLTLNMNEGKDVDRGKFIVISATYRAPLLTSFAFKEGVTLTENRKVWLAPDL